MRTTLKMDKNLTIYCLSISGGCFVNQLGLLQEVYEARIYANGGKITGKKSYAPDICFGASGGNVAAYVGLAADWSSQGIFRVSRLLEHKYFARKWVPEQLALIPNLLIGLFKGSIYQAGYGAKELFERIFTEESIQRVEIWTGVYNSDLKQAQFFCNRSREKSLVNDVFFNEEQFRFDSLPLKFTNGNIEELARVSIASASIPIVVPNQQIDNFMYADGGVMYASPLSVFATEIERIVRNDHYTQQLGSIVYKHGDFIRILNDTNRCTYTISRNGRWLPSSFYLSPCSTNCYSSKREKKRINVEMRNLRLFYFMPYQPDRTVLDKCCNKKNDMEREMELIDQLLHVNLLRDREAGIELLKRLDNDIEYSSFPEMNTKKLGKLLKHLNSYKHYVICLYVHGRPSINLTNFTPDDVEDAIISCRKGYGVEVWAAGYMEF